MGFTLCSSAGLAVGSNGFDTMHVVCTDWSCVVCIGLSAEFSAVNTGLGRPMFWKPVSVEYSWGSGYHKLSTDKNYLHFQHKSRTFSRKISKALSELLISSFISSKPGQHSIVFHNILTMVSQLSKCLKFMTFREGCFKARSWMQVLKMKLLRLFITICFTKGEKTLFQSIRW